jgi:hypothetical protein
MSKAIAPIRVTGRTDKGVDIMFKRIALSTAVALAGLTAMPAAAEAQSRYGYSSPYDNGYYSQGQRYDRRYDRRYSQRYANQRYQNQRYGNYYGRQCSNGSTGTIIGAIAGGLLGREIAGRGDRTVGAIIGGAAGALAGREIDRSGRNCRR